MQYGKQSMTWYFQVEGSRRLRDRVTMAGLDVLSVSSGPNSQNVLKRIEREASHRLVISIFLFKMFSHLVEQIVSQNVV